MILTHDLTKQFEQLLAVDSVNLQVNAGSILALLGPNGAGKTTTVRMLTSVLRPTRGWAQVAGYDTVKQPAQVRASVGILTEQHGLYGRMYAREYLDFFGQIYKVPPKIRQKNIDNLLEGFGLDPNDKKRLAEYSKGMRQKLALARALIHQPSVLLLDEPTSAMDPESARLVRDAIHSLKSEKRAIIICTHNLNEAEELADTIAIIRRGRIILQGSPEGLKQTLLGSPEFEVQLGTPLDGICDDLSNLVEITHHGNLWFRYRTNRPTEDNPSLLQRLIELQIPVISLQEVNRSLEQVYLQAINTPDRGDNLLNVD